MFIKTHFEKILVIGIMFEAGVEGIGLESSGNACSIKLSLFMNYYSYSVLRKYGIILPVV